MRCRTAKDVMNKIRELFDRINPIISFETVLRNFRIFTASSGTGMLKLDEMGIKVLD